MRKTLFSTVALAAFIAGCAQPTMRMDTVEKPMPAPELAKLGRMVGTWTGTAEMISPKPEPTSEKPIYPVTTASITFIRTPTRLITLCPRA